MSDEVNKVSTCDKNTSAEIAEFVARRARTLPESAAERKAIPVYSGCVAYFPAALCEVAKVSKAGNDQHNPGEPLHWARGKSTDQLDAALRHSLDQADALATNDLADAIRVAAQKCWRDLADLQLLCERAGAPKAPGAR